MLNHYQLKMFVETCKMKRMSKKEFDNSDSSTQKQYLKDYPTSTFGKKTSKKQRQAKSDMKYNLDLNKAKERADKLGIRDEFRECMNSDPYLLHNWKINDYSKDYIINECKSKDFLKIKSKIKEAIVTEIKNRKLELDTPSRSGVIFYDKKKNERNFRINDNAKMSGFRLTKESPTSLFCYLQEDDFKSPKITKETSDSEIKEIVEDFFDKVL